MTPTTKTLVPLVLTAALALHGCGDKDADTAGGGDHGGGSTTAAEGTNPSECTDGVDNDSDGLTDCDDEGCFGSPDCEADDSPTHAGGGDMVRVSAASFNMGCTAGQADCRGDEYPVMPVTLTRDFYVGVTEVTQGEYETVMGTNPSAFTECGANCPVNSVSWYQAAAFTNALSAAEGLTQCYTCTGSDAGLVCTNASDPYGCAGYRLLTEAEWEHAARCGTDLRFSGSDQIDDVGWWSGNSGSAPQPVAGKAPNACGLHDMSGNVWEMTQDGYDAEYYTAEGRTNPIGDGGDRFTFRGGGWDDIATQLRVAFRNSRGRNNPEDQIGFRVARTAP